MSAFHFDNVLNTIKNLEACLENLRRATPDLRNAGVTHGPNTSAAALSKALYLWRDAQELFNNANHSLKDGIGIVVHHQDIVEQAQTLSKNVFPIECERNSLLEDSDDSPRYEDPREVPPPPIPPRHPDHKIPEKYLRGGERSQSGSITATNSSGWADRDSSVKGTLGRVASVSNSSYLSYNTSSTMSKSNTQTTHNTLSPLGPWQTSRTITPPSGDDPSLDDQSPSPLTPDSISRSSTLASSLYSPSIHRIPHPQAPRTPKKPLPISPRPSSIERKDFSQAIRLLPEEHRAHAAAARKHQYWSADPRTVPQICDDSHKSQLPPGTAKPYQLMLAADAPTPEEWVRMNVDFANSILQVPPWEKSLPADAPTSEEILAGALQEQKRAERRGGAGNERVVDGFRSLVRRSCSTLKGKR